MKGVKCSWIDMQKIREALALAEHGDETRLAQMRCVDQSTVSTWKKICELLNAIEGKYELNHISHFQPTHALEIVRHVRSRDKNAQNWTPEIKEEIADWIDRCESEELTVVQLREKLRDERQREEGSLPPDGGCKTQHLESLVNRGFRYGTIYADPPWQYDNQATRASTSNHYGTMTVDEIAALPVKDLAADNAHLHLWTTNAFLFECPRIMEAWGFTYKSMFIWCKPQIGIGNYWRVSHEIMLLGVRGSCPFNDHSLRSWLECERDKHSSKPGQVREMIQKASPGPYLELFSRLSVPGWTVWGNQIDANKDSQMEMYTTPTLEAI